MKSSLVPFDISCVAPLSTHANPDLMALSSDALLARPMQGPWWKSTRVVLAVHAIAILLALFISLRSHIALVIDGSGGPGNISCWKLPNWSSSSLIVSSCVDKETIVRCWSDVAKGKRDVSSGVEVDTELVGVDENLPCSSAVVLSVMDVSSSSGTVSAVTLRAEPLAALVGLLRLTVMVILSLMTGQVTIWCTFV